VESDEKAQLTCRGLGQFASHPFTQSGKGLRSVLPDAAAALDEQPAPPSASRLLGEGSENGETVSPFLEVPRRDAHLVAA
jgi:hypothetical protein